MLKYKVYTKRKNTCIQMVLPSMFFSGPGFCLFCRGYQVCLIRACHDLCPANGQNIYLCLVCNWLHRRECLPMIYANQSQALTELACTRWHLFLCVVEVYFHNYINFVLPTFIPKLINARCDTGQHEFSATQNFTAPIPDAESICIFLCTLCFASMFCWLLNSCFHLGMNVLLNSILSYYIIQLM